LNHSKVREMLSAYLDGELEPSLARAVEEHLRGCAECTGYLERLRGLNESIRSTRPAMPDEGYFEFFPSRVTAEARSRTKGIVAVERLQLRLARVRIAATALVVVMAFGIGFFYGQRELRTVTPLFFPIPVERTRRIAAAEAVSESAVKEGERRDKSSVGWAEGNEGLAAAAGTGVESFPLAEKKKGREIPSREPAGEEIAGMLGAEEAETARAPSEAAEKYLPEVSIIAAPATKPRTRKSEMDEEKGETVVDAVETYALANVAQLEQDYGRALQGYAEVLKLSPGTELASAAQYQMNVVAVGPDSTIGAEGLKEKARLWEEWIRDYPGSSLLLSACDQYTEALYLVAIRTGARADAEKALSAIESCSTLVREKMPPSFQQRTEELRGYTGG
jgi:hypothetical protein